MTGLIDTVIDSTSQMLDKRTVQPVIDVCDLEILLDYHLCFFSHAPKPPGLIYLMRSKRIKQFLFLFDYENLSVITRIIQAMIFRTNKLIYPILLFVLSGSGVIISVYLILYFRTHVKQHAQ